MPGLISWDSSSSEGSLSSSAESVDIPIFDQELQYPDTPELRPVVLLRTPSIRALSLTPPPASPTALQNLPQTTPPAAPTSCHPTLGHFVQAALSTAEKALGGFKMTIRTPGAELFRDLENRIWELEQAASGRLASPQLQDPSTQFPFDEELDARMEASNRLAHLLAENLREPTVYRAEIDAPSIDTDLLLGFSKQAVDFQKPALDTAPRLAIDLSAMRTPPTPHTSPSTSPTTPDFFSLNNDEQPENLALTEEEQRMMDDVFDFLSDDEGAAPGEDELAAAAPRHPVEHRPMSRRGHELNPDTITTDEQLEEAFHLNLDDEGAPPRPDYQAMDTHLDPQLGAPPSRRPAGTQCGIVTYNRRPFGWHDYLGTPFWPRENRERDEAIGYALEFADRFVLYARHELGDALFSNLQLARFRHTERRLRLEDACSIRPDPLTPHPDGEFPPDVYPDARRHHLIPRPGNRHLPEFIVNDFGDADSDTDSETSLPEELRVPDITVPFLRYYARLEREHNICTTLAPISRTARYSPILIDSCFTGVGFTLTDGLQPPISSLREEEEHPAKRRRTDEAPLVQRVLTAEALNATLRYWHTHIGRLRSLRSDVAFAIQRFIEIIEWLGLRSHFRRIFFPFQEDFSVTTVFQMYAMERMHNPDGHFRRNPYHLNALLHDAECNFLQSCAILFRQTQDFELAYTVEELLATSFRDDSGIMQIFREGFIESHYETTAAFFNFSYGTLHDRLSEVAEDYPGPENRRRDPARRPAEPLGLSLPHTTYAPDSAATSFYVLPAITMTRTNFTTPLGRTNSANDFATPASIVFIPFPAEPQPCHPATPGYTVIFSFPAPVLTPSAPIEDSLALPRVY
ncbi:hypothetical protein DFH09DRAFT_1412076 [Mycena vulgaris]|nr:hypothetical protein DFH09DRAFT_1412076 [Mycena vulgaris]